MAGGEQQIGQALGPGLPQLLKDLGQFAPAMGMAQTVLAGAFPIGLPAIVDQRSHKRGQQPEGLERLVAAVEMRTEPGQQRGRQDRHPVELAPRAQAGFVGMSDRGAREYLADRGDRRGEPHRRLGLDRQHRGIGHRQAEPIAHEHRGCP